MAANRTASGGKKKFERNMDGVLDLLDELTEEELAALDAEFDPNDDLRGSADRKLELQKNRMYEKRDMVAQLENLVKKNQTAPTPPTKITPNRVWKNNTLNASKDNIKRTDKKKNNNDKNIRKFENKKEEKIDYALTEEEEELFEGITDEDLIEIAALSNMHGLVTQDQLRAVEMGEKPSAGNIVMAEHVNTPQRRLMSLSEDNADLDAVLLMDSLEEDTDDVFYIRINNVPLETPVLHGIFNALKTTKKIKHLSLAGIGLKDEDGLIFNQAFAQNETLETLNLESNNLTNESMEPLFKILETHKTIREFKCAHQKHGLGSRGEEAMARALDRNERLLKISYPFKVPSARTLADRCQIRNQEMLRQKRTKGEDFYNYKEEIKKRDEHAQPWIREREDKNEKMKSDLAEQKGRMKSVPNVGRMRAEAKLRAKENAKPTMDNELANKLQAARKPRGRVAR